MQNLCAFELLTPRAPPGVCCAAHQMLLGIFCYATRRGSTLMSHLPPAARGCRGGAKVTIWLPTDVPSASTKESTGQARGSVLWHWAMWRSTLMSHTPQPRVPRSTLPRARQLPPGQERGVADCVLVDPVLLHLVPSRHLQQPSGERRSSVSRGGKPAHAPRARWLPFIISQTISAQAHRLVQATVAGAWGDGNIL